MSTVLESKPLGEFLSALLGENLSNERFTAAKTQAWLIVLDDYLKSGIDEVKQRADALFQNIDKPEVLENKLRVKFSDDVRASSVINERFSLAFTLVNSCIGLGDDHKAVPPFGAILINKKLGLVDRDTVDAALLAQTALRLKTVLEGRTNIFPEARITPFDSDILKETSTALNDVQKRRAENVGLLPKDIDVAAYRATALTALETAGTTLNKYPQAQETIAAAIEALGAKHPGASASNPNGPTPV